MTDGCLQRNKQKYVLSHRMAYRNKRALLFAPACWLRLIHIWVLKSLKPQWPNAEGAESSLEEGILGSVTVTWWLWLAPKLHL